MFRNAVQIDEYGDDGAQYDQAAKQEQEAAESDELQGLLAEDSVDAPNGSDTHSRQQEQEQQEEQEQWQQRLPASGQPPQQQQQFGGPERAAAAGGRGRGRDRGRGRFGRSAGPGMHAAVQHPQQQQHMRAQMSPFMPNGIGSYSQQAMLLQGE